MTARYLTNDHIGQAMVTGSHNVPVTERLPVGSFREKIEPREGTV